MHDKETLYFAIFIQQVMRHLKDSRCTYLLLLHQNDFVRQNQGFRTVPYSVGSTLSK